jgi:catechol 1,2-dioxygenase
MKSGDSNAVATRGLAVFMLAAALLSGACAFFGSLTGEQAGTASQAESAPVPSPREASSGQPCRLTPADMEGPYYLPGAPLTNDIAPEGLEGQPLIISGTVYGPDCVTPLAGAIVEVWQADAAGDYDFSEQFILRGSVAADANGFYQFETVLPGRYGTGGSFRPAHVHYRVSHPAAQTLVTQLYFEGDPYNAPGQGGQTIAVTEEGGVLHGAFDIVLAGR